MTRPIQATIDLSALRHNLGVVRRHAPRARVMGVIKANGYGHGVMRVASALSEADSYALLELDAAVSLRKKFNTQRIVLLEGLFRADELPVAAAHKLAFSVHHEDQVRMIETYTGAAHFDVLLKVNSGMNRLGFRPAQVPAMLERLQRSGRVETLTLMTHFANADDARGVQWQLDAMRPLDRLTLPRSYANSAAILRYPQTHAEWIRPGIMLYGGTPFVDVPAAKLELNAAMTLTSEIIAVQQLAPGETVGYGGAFTASRNIRIGVVACGYGDGYPRHAPAGTPVWVGDVLCGTVGRVSMDMLCVDITNLPQAGIGTPVELWGARNPVEAVAAAAGTVGYELLCALAPRVPVVERSA